MTTARKILVTFRRTRRYLYPQQYWKCSVLTTVTQSADGRSLRDNRFYNYGTLVSVLIYVKGMCRSLRRMEETTHRIHSFLTLALDCGEWWASRHVQLNSGKKHSGTSEQGAEWALEPVRTLGERHKSHARVGKGNRIPRTPFIVLSIYGQWCPVFHLFTYRRC